MQVTLRPISGLIDRNHLSKAAAITLSRYVSWMCRYVLWGPGAITLSRYVLWGPGAITLCRYVSCMCRYVLWGLIQIQIQFY